MWSSRIESLDHGRIRRYFLDRHDSPLARSEVIQLWQADESFRMFFVSLLADVPFPAFFWETPPVTMQALDQPFEFVLVDSRQLAGVSPEPDAFREHCAGVGQEEGIACFQNLGGDAFLVAPCPRGKMEAYAHLAVFSREGPREQNHALWMHVGAAMEQRISAHPLWLSTAGTGVYWLHVRLDSRPKYYTYQPYRNTAWVNSIST